MPAWCAALHVAVAIPMAKKSTQFGAQMVATRSHDGVGQQEVEAEQLTEQVERGADQERVAHLHLRCLLGAQPDQQDRDHREHEVEEVLGGEAPRLRDRVVALLPRTTAERDVLAREREQQRVVEERVLRAAEDLAEEQHAEA